MTAQEFASTLTAVVCAWLIGMGAAQAQTSFSDVRLSVGDRVQVTLVSGETVEGTVAVVSPGTIGVNGRDLTPTEVRRIDKVGDSLWDGTAISFAMGAVRLRVDKQRPCGDLIRCSLLPGLAAGAIGMLIDRMREHRDTVFGSSRVTLVPVAGRTYGALVLRLSY